MRKKEGEWEDDFIKDLRSKRIVPISRKRCFDCEEWFVQDHKLKMFCNLCRKGSKWSRREVEA